MKPIIFSTPMVQAILAGRKTQTRRAVKEDRRGEWAAVNGVRNNSEYGASVPCYLHRETAVDDISRNIMYPKYDVGDILWVRETWALQECEKCRAGMPSLGGECKCDYVYRTNYGKTEDDTFPPSMFRWRPSIHMPREAARLFLRVTDVRVERVRDITEADADAEGAAFYSPKFKTDVATIPWRMTTSRTKFCALWDSIYAERGYGWDSNPWVWVYSFERVDKPAGWPGGEVEG